MGDAQDMVERIHDVAKLVESGSDAIEKELEQTYENVLGRKLGTPEGMALIKAKIAEIEGASTAAPAAAPAPADSAADFGRRPGQVVSNIPVATVPVAVIRDRAGSPMAPGHSAASHPKTGGP